MGELIAHYSSMPMLLQIFWGCAVIASLIFIVQITLTLIGIDSNDTDVDFDGTDTMDLGGGFNLFTIKNLMVFLIGFGWTGVCFWDTIESRALLSLLAVIIGSLFVGIFFVIYKQTKRLEHNGAFQIKDINGKVADVYLRIPEQGKGKIQVSINGSVHEFDAINGETPIASGSKVRVTGIINSETVRVEPIALDTDNNTEKQ